MLYRAELRAHLNWVLVEELDFNNYNKEVIQPQVPLRLPCDDLTHLTELRFGIIKELHLI